MSSTATPSDTPPRLTVPIGGGGGGTPGPIPKHARFTWDVVKELAILAPPPKCPASPADVAAATPEAGR